MSNSSGVQTGNTGRKGVRAINEPGAKGAVVKKIGAQGFKGLKSLHLFFVSLWIGGSISLLCVHWLTVPGTAGEISLKYSIMEIIDYGLIIPIFLVAVIGISVFKPKWAVGALAGRPKKTGVFQKTEVAS